MKNKSTILLWTDAALLLLLLALSATGAVMHWVLPPGGGGRSGGIPGQAGSGGAAAAHRELLDLTRHEWGDVHFWIAAVLVALIVFHLVLHWNWITASVRRAFESVVNRHPHPRTSSPDRSKPWT